MDALPVSGEVKDALNSVAQVGASVAVSSVKASDHVKLKSADGGVELRSSDVSNPLNNKAGGGVGSSPAKPAPGVSGGRAAAMKETFGSSIVASADEKLAQAEASAAFKRRVDEMEAKITNLEKKVSALENAPKPSGGCCVIC